MKRLRRSIPGEEPKILKIPDHKEDHKQPGNRPGREHKGVIEDEAINSLSDIRQERSVSPGSAPEMAKMNRELKKFLRENLYYHHRVLRMADKATRIIGQLFETYMNEPRTLPPKNYLDIERIGKERAICDHIAGMTDRFALDEYKKLFDPYEKV